MIGLFLISFGAGLIMFITGLIRSISVKSGLFNHYNDSSYSRRAAKAGLRKHWIITWILFGIAIYAGINL